MTWHSQVPEWEIVRTVPEVLSPYGTYIVHHPSPSFYFLRDRQNYLHRSEGIRLAHDELKLRGLRKVEYVEQGERKGEKILPAVFKNAFARPIIA